MELIALETIRVDGEKVLSGESFDVSEELAERLVKRGIAEYADTHEDPETPEDLESMTVAELRDLAKELGLHGYSDLKKDELIEAIGEAE